MAGTCGDHGGKEGTCGLAAGWGRGAVTSGKCRHHFDGAGGRPVLDFPTDDQLAQIERLAGMLTTDQLADFFQVSRSTFYRRVNDDARVMERYNAGKARVAAQVAGNLVKRALDGHIRAMEFYLRTQCGWSERHRVELSGPEGGPIRHEVDDATDQELLERAAQLSNRLKVTSGNGARP